MRPEHTAPRARTLGAESLARQIAHTVGTDADVVLDANSAERQQLLDRLPVDQPRAIIRAQRAEETRDEVHARFDGEHLTGLDHRGIPQKLVLRTRWTEFHADIVGGHTERMAEPVR